MQPIQNTKVQAYLSPEQGKRVEWANYWLTSGFDGMYICVQRSLLTISDIYFCTTALEKHLVKTAGTYCVGDQVTLADCSLYPMSYNGYRYKVNMSDYPTVTRVLDNLEKLEPFQAAHAHVQIDCLPELHGKSMKDL
jgi:maleylacetoacetate isomerase